MKPKKTELKKKKIFGVSPHLNGKYSILALHDAPMGAFCNACMLQLAVVCL